MFTRGGGGGEGERHFHCKVIGMLVVFSVGYKILILVFFRVFWKMSVKLKPFSPKQPSKLQLGYLLGVQNHNLGIF